jgi:uncharacterized delta-60 repeat protein
MSVRFVRVLAVSVGVIAAAASLPPASAAATTGFLDKTFSGDGRVLTNVHNDDDGEALAVQADGKIVVAGSSSGGTDVAVVRYDTDGTLDTSFGGGDGIVVTDVNGDDAAYSVAIQDDQKIVVGGTTDGSTQALLLRYDTGGALDTSFGGGDGITTTAIGVGALFFDLAIQGDGAIVAAGATTPDGFKGLALVARYDSSGVLDTGTFASPDGYVTTNLGASGGQMMGLALQGDGKIVTAGSSFSTTSSNVALLRYTAAGALDPTFGGGDGKVTTDVATGLDFGGDVAIDTDGNIDVVGAAGQKDVFLRYDDTGALDASFGGGDGITLAGRGGFNGLSGIAIRGTGEIVGVDAPFGSSPISTFKVVQVTSTGALDSSFGDGGIANVAFSLNYHDQPIANDVAIDGNGAVVVAGTAGTGVDIAVARFGDAAKAVIGQPDLRIGTGGTLIGDGIYNETGNHQTLSRRVSRGHSFSFSVNVQNDGNAPDQILVRGGFGRGYRITYSLAGKDVTRSVLGFIGKKLALDPGQSKTLKVVVKVSSKATIGKVLKVRTDGYSFNTLDAEDAVLAKITVKR